MKTKAKSAREREREGWRREKRGEGGGQHAVCCSGLISRLGERSKMVRRGGRRWGGKVRRQVRQSFLGKFTPRASHSDTANKTRFTAALSSPSIWERVTGALLRPKWWRSMARRARSRLEERTEERVPSVLIVSAEFKVENLPRRRRRRKYYRSRDALWGRREEKSEGEINEVCLVMCGVM